MTEKQVAAFWAKVDKSPEHGGCWLWTGGKSHNGYGQLQPNRKPLRAHRVAWELANGKIPDGLCACHSCDVPSCVNPSHVWIGTQLENIADRVKKHRTASGERNGARLHPERIARGDNHHSRLHPERIARGDRHMSVTHPEKLRRGDNHPARLHPERLARGECNGLAKLTESGVREIRAASASGRSNRAISREYGVNQTTIGGVINGKTWKHVLP